MQQYDAVILAGGINSGELRKFAPYDNEALIVIGECPMICYVYRAVKQSPRIRNVIISHPNDALRELFKKEEGVIFTPSGEDAIDSFGRALETVGAENFTSHLVVLPTDIPFLTTEALDDFISRCEETEADFYYSIVDRKTNEARFPQVVRTYVKIADGVFTGGNLFMIKTGVVPYSLDMGKKLIANRKKPVAQARLFGLGLLLRYIFGRLSIEDVEKRFEKVLGIKGRAVISPYAEVGVDVDKPSDLKLAEQFLGQK